MRVLSVVMTHGERSRTVGRIVERLRAFSFPSEIYIWNNGPYDLAVEGVRVVNGVNDCGEVQKLTLPLILDGYDIFFYCDDDMAVHERFLEHSVRLLGRNERFLICTGGSVVERGDPRRRRWIPATSLPPRPFYADFADLNCFVIRRENVPGLVRLGLSSSRPWNTDLFFSASYWDSGGIIYVPEQPDESRLCARPDPEHFRGLCAAPDFVGQRNRSLEALLAGGWRPRPKESLAAPPLFWP